MDTSVTGTAEKPAQSSNGNFISDWVGEARRILVQLGVHVKNMIAEAHKLAQATMKSRDAISNCRETSDAMMKSVLQAEKLMEDPQINVYAIKEFLADMKMFAEKASLDVEIAQTCLDEVVQAASDIDEHISNTTATMLQEAKMIQELKGKAGP